MGTDELRAFIVERSKSWVPIGGEYDLADVLSDALRSPEGRAVVARALASNTFAIDVLKASGYRVYTVDNTDVIGHVERMGNPRLTERTGDGDEHH